MELLSSSIEQFPKRDALEAATRKISKIKEFADTLLFLSHQCKFWSNFTEICQSTYPINSFKQEELFRKTNASFRPPKICKHGTPYQRDMSTRKAVNTKSRQPTKWRNPGRSQEANKNFAGKLFSARRLFGVSHQWGKQKQSNPQGKTKGNRGASADARLQGGTRENRISRIKSLPRKTRKGVHAFWGLWHLDGLLTLLKNLFFSITRVRFEILFSFFRNMLALIMTFLLVQKNFFGKNQPLNVCSNLN